MKLLSASTEACVQYQKEQLNPDLAAASKTGFERILLTVVSMNRE